MNPVVPATREIEEILASNLQHWEKVERIAGAIRRDNTAGPEAAAWLLVMMEARRCR